MNTPESLIARARRKPPTAAQLRCLSAIVEHIFEHGFPPSRRELTDRLGLSSTHAVHDTIVRLERRGLVERGRKRSFRTLNITSDGIAALAWKPPVYIAQRGAQ